MTKWDYIRLISQRGDRYGNSGGVASLLDWCGKDSTYDVTEAEAGAFLAHGPDKPPAFFNAAKDLFDESGPFSCKACL